GNLVRVEDADGWVTEYTYDERHRLVRQRLGTGLTFFYRYDRSDRCVETWGEYPGMTDPALAPDLPETLRDGQTRARGIHHVVIEYDEDGGSTAYDSVRFQRYFAEENGTISNAVNGSGGVTTRPLHEEGRDVEKIDRLGRSSKYDQHVLDNDARKHYGDLRRSRHGGGARRRGAPPPRLRCSGERGGVRPEPCGRARDRDRSGRQHLASDLGAPRRGPGAHRSRRGPLSVSVRRPRQLHL